jgi:hypothetical protein
VPAHRCGARARTRCAIRWGSAVQNPTGEVRGSHRVTHRGRTDCVAPTVPRRRLSRSRPPRSLSKLGVRLLSRERRRDCTYASVASTRIPNNQGINEPSTVVFGARRAVLCAGRARSAPPPARRARGQHPADGHGHAVYNIRKTDTFLHRLAPGRTATGHSFLQRAIRARANTDRSTLDSQLLLDCNKYYFDASRKIRYFCASRRQRWKLDEKVVPRLWCQEPSTAIAVTALAHCDVCAPESCCELIRAVRSVRG